jgi:hypothetical protein
MRNAFEEQEFDHPEFDNEELDSIVEQACRICDEDSVEQEETHTWPTLDPSSEDCIFDCLTNMRNALLQDFELFLCLLVPEMYPLYLVSYHESYI